MSTRLVLLGLLKERPLYGYELKHIIESHMGDWTNIAFGSIYFALKKLTEEGMVEEVGSEKDGGRPSRRIYGITGRGKGEFLNLLEELWTSENREYYPLDIGLFFMDQLPKEKRLPLVEGRLAGLENNLAHLEEHFRITMDNPHVPPVSEAIFSHSLYHMKAEIAWLTELRDKIAQGVY